MLAVPKYCLEGELNRTLQSLSVLYPVSSANGKDLVPLGAHHTLSCTSRNQMDNLLHVSFCPVICCDVGYFANQRYALHLGSQQRCSLPIHCAKRTPRCIEFPENGLNSVMILGCRKCGNLNLKFVRCEGMKHITHSFRVPLPRVNLIISFQPGLSLNKQDSSISFTKTRFWGWNTIGRIDMHSMI